MIRRSPHTSQAAVLPQVVTPEQDESAGADSLGSTPAETAQYIAQMMAELAVIARRARFDLLAYFLDMARTEAAAQARATRETQDG